LLTVKRKTLHVAADHHWTTDMIAVVAGVVLTGVLLSGPRPLSARELAARRCSGSPRTSPPSTPHVGIEVRPGRSGSGHPTPRTSRPAACMPSARGSGTGSRGAPGADEDLRGHGRMAGLDPERRRVARRTRGHGRSDDMMGAAVSGNVRSIDALSTQTRQYAPADRFAATANATAASTTPGSRSSGPRRRRSA
jgi:hypothetical protein